MVIAIDPVLFRLGPLAVRWFGVLALLGLAVATWLSVRALRRAPGGPAGLSHSAAQLALDALAWALPAGIVAARLVHVLGYWGYYFQRPSELWQLNLDGLSLWGGLIGGGLVAVARLRGDPSRRRRILDTLAPYAALGISIGRLGEFLDGQGQGLPSALPWATQYTSALAATPDFGVPRHPAQVYDALIALALSVALLMAPKSLPGGTRAAAFALVYGAGRVLLGAVRLDPAFVFGLQIEQLLALTAIAWGAWYALSPQLARASVAHLKARVRGRAEEDSLAA